jgi:hypothetical protein
VAEQVLEWIGKEEATQRGRGHDKIPPLPALADLCPQDPFSDEDTKAQRDWSQTQQRALSLPQISCLQDLPGTGELRSKCVFVTSGPRGSLLLWTQRTAGPVAGKDSSCLPTRYQGLTWRNDTCCVSGDKVTRVRSVRTAQPFFPLSWHNLESPAFRLSEG